ncbi:RNA polymerase sigma factor, sigma-70 family [Desulfosporosinus orientis DSM 765]|uniref:RNA polymerase sigma factor, sigma-70 family n=1 Tax=Desulfosporosinus orientis (strain ATCC 19365 / DSM 765 / NCIMB 8382 / VKM B-1628 / Singapore I) TaxID=768706 RepID=G7WA04_DESOD|nr:RNA polymerase sigma factor [Desulfosporosinus orientis]AET66000.1 RNA polymerase sigma factor, sigma-70 family [Desulfosporosinus orientis DSM 765]
MEDAEIIRLVLAGHHEQYAGLVQRYQEPLILFLRRILNSEEDSFDCAQEAFLAAYRNLNRYSKEYPFRAWLYAIARNKALDLMRKRHREVLSIPDETMVDQRPNPEEVVLAKEETALLSEVLHELPEQYGQALYLRYRQELSYKEIAMVLQVPVSSVKTYIHRGKEKLRQILERREIRGGKGQPIMEEIISR